MLIFNKIVKKISDNENKKKDKSDHIEFSSADYEGVKKVDKPSTSQNSKFKTIFAI